MPLTMLSSTKGRNLLAYNGHQYMTERVNGDGSVTWRCKMLNKYRCNVTLNTNRNEVIREPGRHTHNGDALDVHKQIVLTDIRNAA